MTGERTRPTGDNVREIRDRAHRLVGKWGRDRFRVGNQLVFVTARRDPIADRVIVHLMDTSGSGPKYPARSINVFVIPFSPAQILFEQIGTQQPSKKGILRSKVNMKDLPYVGEPPGVDEVYVAPLRLLTIAKNFSSEELAKMRVDKYGRTAEEKERERANVARFIKKTNDLLEIAIQEGKFEEVDEVAYNIAGRMGPHSGLIKVPLYQARFSLGANRQLTITQHKSGLGGVSIRMFNSVLITSDNSDPQEFTIRRKRIYERTQTKSVNTQAYPVDAEAGEGLVAKLEQLTAEDLL